MTPYEKLMHEISTQLNRSKTTLDKWNEKFHDNPLYAFDWSDSAQQAACELDFYTWLETAFTPRDDKPIPEGDELREFAQSVLKHVTQDVLRMARSAASNSTSSSRNQIEAHMLAVKADFIDDGFSSVAFAFRKLLDA
jgi:hypothetical protein